MHGESELAKMKKGTVPLLSNDASTDIEFHSSRNSEKVVQQESTKSLHKKGSPMVPEHSYKVLSLSLCQCEKSFWDVHNL